jgi:hypothetical protein
VSHVVYYESIKRDLKTRPTYECRCDERLKTKDEEPTRLVYTNSILLVSRASVVTVHLEIYCCLLSIEKARAKDKTFVKSLFFRVSFPQPLFF